MAGLLGMEGGIDPQMLQMIMQQMGAQNANPMQRPIEGEEYLSGLGQLPIGVTPFNPASAQNPVYGGQPQLGGQEMPPEMPPVGMQPPTDFSGTSPGLPNLPDSFEGFGYGQFSPKQVSPRPSLRQRLLSTLLG